MEQATALVALAGDLGNSVPKTVTPAEILVLQAEHGPGAVHDIFQIADVDRTRKDELARLNETYEGYDEDGKRRVNAMFPSATLLPLTIAELGLEDQLFKATARALPVRKAVVQTEQTHGAPGQEPVRVALDNTEFDPIEVPADPEDEARRGTMTEPWTQHQIDKAPGDAFLAAGKGNGPSSDLDALKSIADTGPGERPSQTGAPAGALGGHLETRGAKTAEEKTAEVAPGRQAAQGEGANALFAE
jgi:hypothetical protein